jgi:aspartyl/asparaginyl beta-hydroxylase
MRYFFRLAENVEVLPLMEAIMRQHELWNEDKTRTTFEDTPHADVDDILLRFGKPDGDSLEAWDLPAMVKLPGAKLMCLQIMALVKGSRLGRVVITKTEPGKKILPHSDVIGEYSKYYTRYHVVLQGLPGSLFMCGDESVNMKTGELWWFDANAEHSVSNNSKDDRVHMLIDVRIDK